MSSEYITVNVTSKECPFDRFTDPVNWGSDPCCNRTYEPTCILPLLSLVPFLLVSSFQGEEAYDLYRLARQYNNFSPRLASSMCCREETRTYQIPVSVASTARLESECLLSDCTIPVAETLGPSFELDFHIMTRLTFLFTAVLETNFNQVGSAKVDCTAATRAVSSSLPLY